MCEATSAPLFLDPFSSIIVFSSISCSSTGSDGSSSRLLLHAPTAAAALICVSSLPTSFLNLCLLVPRTNTTSPAEMDVGATIAHGLVDGVTHSGPTKFVLYFTGATNILYTFGSHAITIANLLFLVPIWREIMHAMWKPQKFKYIYLLAIVYAFTLTLLSTTAVYWAFGDQLLNHSNAFSLLPKTGWRDIAIILRLIHQFITFGFT
ncbi:Amino acid transporter, transmembrane [Canna indica]|uniref:Amino acid transporter, transmembrane n=1 Tax=Canna indica TaxID=4628 RepID=A0AAQ3KAW9_9LILI|nr:Amino acid transporter, transmembrane [Canna indica]